MTNPSVLIVEDEAIIALHLKLDLTRLGYDVRGTLSTGEEAVDRAEADPPDLILMDIRLSGEMDGLEASRRIRTFSDVPILFLTGFSKPDMEPRISALAPSAVIRKPAGTREVVRVMADLLGEAAPGPPEA